MASQSSVFTTQQFTDAGDPLVGGRIYTYVPGTTTHRIVYTDAAATVAFTYTNDGLGGEYIALDARGELTASMYFTADTDILLKRADGSTVWTRKAVASGAALAGSAGSDSIGHISDADNAVATTVGAKLRETVDLASDYAVIDSVSDQSAKIQQAIDDLPSTGGPLRWPRYQVICHNIKLQGTSGGKSNVIIQGQGPASKAKAPASSAYNVFEGITTSGCGVEDMEVIGSRGNGGTETPGPSRGFAASGMVVAVNDRVEVSSTNTYTTTVSAGNLVYRCTTGVTLGATFAADIANFTLVAEANFNTSDLSYRYGHGIYFDDATACYAKNVKAKDCVYAGFNPGTGPVQVANAGPGTDRCKLINVEVENCDNAVSGGKIRDIQIRGIGILDNLNYGVVIDADSGDCQVTGINAQGCDNHALYVYNARNVTIDDYTISDCLNGIIVENGATLISIGQGTVTGCTNLAMLVRNAPIVKVSGLVAHNNVGSVEITNTYACSVDLIVSGTTGSGKSGLVITNSSIVTVGPGTICTGNNLHGIELVTADQVTLCGGLMSYDNNTSNDANGAGIQGTDTTNVSLGTGLTCLDTRAGGSKTQKYGIRTTGTSSAWTGIGLRLAGNATGTTSMVGTNTMELNDNARAVFAIGSAVGAAASAPAFGAETIITVRDVNGTLRYVPAKNAVW